MTIAVDVEIAKLRADLVDDDAVTWTDAELLECLNEAVRATVTVRPDSYVTTGPIPLVAGTIQSLPDGATALFDILENTAPPFKRVTQVDQALLDETYRFWPGNTPQSQVDHYCADPRDKLQWRCYPPNNGDGEVMSSYGDTPADMTLTDVLPLGDQYEPALYARAMGSAYRRNTQRQDLGKTTGYYSQWAQLLGLNAQAAAAVAPKVSKSEGNG